MPIRYLKKHAVLEGCVSVEDAEALTQWMLQQRAPAVHMGRCEHVHGAVLQVLLAFQPKLAAAPPDPLLCGVMSGAAGPRTQALPKHP